MGGRSSGSGFSSAMSAPGSTTAAASASAATHKLTFAIPGTTKMDVEVQYTGTTAEIQRADQITAVLINNILSSAQTRQMVSLIDHPAMSPATWATVRSQQLQVLREAGYPETGAGFEQYRLDTSGALKFIRNAHNAKDVIDKYGSKVPADAAIPGRITGARK